MVNAPLDLANTKTFCCKQVLSTASFKGNLTKRVCKIFHNINRESKYVICLLECDLCNVQYVGKSEIAFNICLNNHRNDAKDPKSSTCL